MDNFLTATQMVEELKSALGRTIRTTDIQEALQDLGYARKIGKKYMPTSEKGIYYCIEKNKQFGNIIKTYYLWNRELLPEIAEVIREKYNI